MIDEKFVGPTKLVVFDTAGVSCDEMCCAPGDAMMKAFSQKGINVSETRVRKFMGLCKDIHIQKVYGLPEVKDAWVDLRGEEDYNRPDPEGNYVSENVRQIYEDFLQFQPEFIDKYIQVIDGAPEVSKLLGKLGIVRGNSTGYTPEQLLRILNKTLIQGWKVDVASCRGMNFRFNKGVYVPEEQSRKVRSRPYPDMVLENRDMAGITDSSLCMKVDDTHMGITAGNDAGMYTLAIAGVGSEVKYDHEEAPYTKEQLDVKIENAVQIHLDHADPDMVVRDIRAVPDAIRYKAGELKKGDLDPNMFFYVK